jgi:hypothetical protein
VACDSGNLGILTLFTFSIKLFKVGTLIAGHPVLLTLNKAQYSFSRVRMTLMEIYEGLKAKYETSDSHGDLYEDY